MSERTGGLCLALTVLVLYPFLLHAETDEVKVELKTVEDRVHATVTSPVRESDQPTSEAGKIDSTISAVEKGTLKVAGKSSRLVGEGTDRAVTTVQKVGTPFFARLMHALDFTQAKQPSETGTKEKSG